MVAVYDYDPIKQSPSKDNSKELPLKKGQYVTVIGDMVSSKAMTVKSFAWALEEFVPS